MFRKVSMILSLVLMTAAAVPAQDPPKLPPVRLVAARDSFFIMSDDKVLGTSIYTVMPKSPGWVIKESTSMPNTGAQLTEVVTTMAGRPLKVTQAGNMGAQKVALLLLYNGGQATGTGQIGAKVSKIDTPVPVDVVDDNLIQALLPRLPWRADARWSVQVFSGGMNTLTTQELVVTDELVVAIPSGKYSAYRVELRNGEAVIAFYISKAPGHRILKIVPGGAPFELISAE